MSLARLARRLGVPGALHRSKARLYADGRAHAPPLCRAASGPGSDLDRLRDISPEMMHVLLEQDRHGRISFERPSSYVSGFQSESMRLSTVRNSIPEAQGRVLGVTPYLLPCWAVSIVYQARLYVVYSQTGRMASSRQLLPTIGTGVTIAAVAPDHWAFGAAFNEVFHVYTGDESSNVSSTVVRTLESTKAYEAAALGNMSLIDGRYDPEHMPMFAYGPPKLSRSEQVAICDAHNYFGPAGEGERQVHSRFELGRDMAWWSSPHYRLVYKLDLDDGRVGICDPSIDVTTSSYILEHPPGAKFTRQPIRAHKKERGSRTLLIRTAASAVDVSEVTGRPDGEPVRVDFLNQSQTRQFQDAVIGAMLRSPANEDMWEDPYILPLYSVGLHSTKDMNDVSQYILQRVAGATSESEPLFPGIAKKEPERELSAHLRTRPRERRPPRQPSRPAPSAQGRPTRQRLSSLGLTSRIDERESVLKSRLRQEVQRQLEWQKLENERRAQRGASASDEERATAGGRELAVTKPLLDSKHHYRRLGLKPRADYLLYSQEDSVNEELKQQFQRLAMMHHPDRAPNEAEEDRRTRIMADINIAYDSLETCELRVQYHNKHYH